MTMTAAPVAAARSIRSDRIPLLRQLAGRGGDAAWPEGAAILTAFQRWGSATRLDQAARVAIEPLAGGVDQRRLLSMIGPSVAAA
jgi:hypothetical protein